MVGKFIKGAKDAGVKLDDREGVQEIMRKICGSTKNTRENRFVRADGGARKLSLFRVKL